VGSCQPSWKAWRTVPFQWIILDAQWSKIERFSFKKLSLHSEQCSILLLLWETNPRPSRLRPGREGWLRHPGCVWELARAAPQTQPQGRLNRSLPPSSSREHGQAGGGSRATQLLSGVSRGADGSHVPCLVLACSPDCLSSLRQVPWGSATWACLPGLHRRHPAASFPCHAFNPEQWEPPQVISFCSSCPQFLQGLSLPHRFLAISTELSQTNKQKWYLREPNTSL